MPMHERGVACSPMRLVNLPAERGRDEIGLGIAEAMGVGEMKVKT